MRRYQLALIGGILISTAFAGPASAFTEVEVTPSVPGTSVTMAPADQTSALKSDGGLPHLSPLEYSDPAAGSGDSSKGTELKIPGLGTIGVLPKLDFGLELLYGSSNPNPPAAELHQEQGAGKDALGDNDVLIRGTLKHRF